jgi:hypothetical protein
LKRGDRKCVATERVTYIAGPAAEVRVVRKIYRLFLKFDLNCSEIARYLNDRNIPRQDVFPWNCHFVKRILSHPKYTGCIVFNRKSQRLRTNPRWNPPSEWIVTCGCFAPLITTSRFDEAQEKLRKRVFLRSDEQLLADLSTFVEKHGKATTQMLAADKYMASSCTYAEHFGSLTRALDRTRQEPTNGLSGVEFRARTKRVLYDELAAMLGEAGVALTRFRYLMIITDRPPVLVDVAKCVKTKSGLLRWEIRHPLGRRANNLTCIALRFAPDNRTRMDYLLLQPLPEARQRLQLSEERIRTIAVVKESLAEIVKVMLSEPPPKRDDKRNPQPVRRGRAQIVR